MAIESGRVLSGRYRLIRPVGHGSQASVWVADHLALNTQVAVKLIDPELAKKEDARERFRREATAAATLRSAHVVQILDHGIDGDQPFIVMELLDGEDLFERLNRRVRLTTQETSKIITQVARALSRAHAAGIVHRDLKPENVFLVPNEDEEIVKVLDFGVAKVADPAKRTMQRTGIGTLIGTPHYMSPEQVKGITEVDFRTDIWALGVIGFQCVTGKMPFDSEGVGDLLIKITIGEIPIPSKHATDVLPEFDQWFARACEREAENRFESARDLADALARAVGGGVTMEDTGRNRFGPYLRAAATAEQAERSAPSSDPSRQPGAGRDRAPTEPLPLTTKRADGSKATAPAGTRRDVAAGRPAPKKPPSGAATEALDEGWDDGAAAATKRAPDGLVVMGATEPDAGVARPRAGAASPDTAGARARPGTPAPGAAGAKADAAPFGREPFDSDIDVEHLGEGTHSSAPDGLASTEPEPAHAARAELGAGTATRTPRPDDRSGGTKASAARRAARAPEEPLATTLASAGAPAPRSVPRSTVSGLSSPGPSVTPPPELDGSRRRRLVGFVAVASVALALTLAWSVVRSHLRAGPTSEGDQPIPAANPPPSTAPDPSVSGAASAELAKAVRPGKAVAPGNPASPSASASPGRLPRPRSGSSASPATKKGRPGDPVIEIPEPDEPAP